VTSAYPSPTRQQLGVRLLAPEEACDFEYWANWLVHAELLRGAVAVALYRLPLLAVPAGTGRRGGSMNLLDESLAELTAQALHALPDFDGVATSGTHVMWGEPVPSGLTPEAKRGFFGLRDRPRNSFGTTWPLAGHRGYGSDTGRWPPASEQQPGQPLPPRAAVPTGAVHAPR
jgi:hypothetical protein